jgi:hypothetical protein
LFGSLLLCGVLAWLLSPPTNDEARYRAMLRDRDWATKAMTVGRGTMELESLRDKIADHLGKRFHADQEALLATGYLTNIFVPAPNGGGATVSTFGERQIIKRVWSLRINTNLFIGVHDIESNRWLITCRPQDVNLVREVLEK